MTTKRGPDAGEAALHYQLAGQELATKLDDALPAALVSRIGHSNWTPEDLRGRLKRVARAGDPKAPSTYFLDNVPLMRVWPPQVLTMPDNSRVIQAQQRIELIAAPAAPGTVQ